MNNLALIDEILLKIEKPVRYIGHEVNSVIKDPEKVDIVLESDKGSLAIVKDGIAADYSEETATEILSGHPVRALLDVHAGEAEATAWGCDLTYEYVKINADYRS